MLIQKQIPSGEYRHNYVRLILLVGTLILFIGHIVVQQLAERGENFLFRNVTLRPEEVVINDITPSYWVYRGLDALHYLWQLAWLLYSLTFIYRRSTGGYLYLSPKTLTPTFYVVYILAFLIPTIWLIFFHQTHIVWSWAIYLISFLLLSLTLFIINNNIAVNKKLYETDGYTGDVWCLRFFIQNGIAFFAALTGIRFALAFNTFLQLHYTISILNAGTISLVLIAIIACTFFFGDRCNRRYRDEYSFEFSPWIVFILFLWGVLENNLTPKDPTRNNFLIAIELILTILSAIAALAGFSLRYRASKIDPLP